MSLLRAFALSLPAVLLAACGAKQPPADDVRVVRTTTVTADEGSSRSDYSGEVRARYESSVGFRVSGRIAQRLVEVGSSRASQSAAREARRRRCRAECRLGACAARERAQRVRAGRARLPARAAPVRASLHQPGRVRSRSRADGKRARQADCRSKRTSHSRATSIRTPCCSRRRTASSPSCAPKPAKSFRPARPSPPLLPTASAKSSSAFRSHDWRRFGQRASCRSSCGRVPASIMPGASASSHR